MTPNMMILKFKLKL